MFKEVQGGFKEASYKHEQLSAAQDHQSKRQDAQNLSIVEARKDIAALREMLEQSRSSDTGKVGHQVQNGAASRTTAQRNFRLRIGGFSPWGSPSDSKLSAAEYISQRAVINTLLSAEGCLSAFAIEDPFAYNFQFLVRLPETDTVNQAFQRRAQLDTILQTAQVTIRGKKLDVRLDADQERKDWHRVYFATWRAVQAEASPDALQQLQEEPRELAVVHHGCRANVFKLAKHTGKIVWSQSVLAAIGCTVESIQRRMADLA